MKCNHTLHWMYQGSSYHVIERNWRKVIVCKVCGKFYGYLREEKKEELLDAAKKKPKKDTR